MAVTVPAPDTDVEVPSTWYALDPEDVVQKLDSDRANGLTAAEVVDRRATYGSNTFTVAETEPQWRAFIRQYRDPMQIVLVVAGVGSIYPLKELGTGLMLLFLTLFNAVLGLRQEGKAAAAVAALQKMMIVKARVRRDGALQELAAEELVPGDVVSLEAGDLVPADGRLLDAATLEVAESALTGESMPVSKGVETVSGDGTALGDRTDMVYMNTNVTRGAGTFVVTETAMATEVGHISHLLQSEDDSETPLTKQLAKLTNQILIVSGLAVVLSIILNLSRGQAFTTVFTAAIAFAVAAIPTGLPAVITTILSMGTQTLAKANAIVKRLRSTETLGSTSAINSDKTGTLTLNQMTAVEMTIPGRRYAIDGSGYSITGNVKHVGGEPEIPLDQFLVPLILASDAVVTDGTLIGDPTEGALVVLAEKGGVDAAATREAYPRIASLPFDAAYKLMATFHNAQDESGRDVVRAYVKGAPDQLLARAGSRLDPSLAVQPIDDDFRDRYGAENERLGEQGLRVMATARKDFDPATFDPTADLLPTLDGMTLLTLVGIVDPPRPQAKAAIADAKSAGIQVRMITGDHAVTAAAIAAKLGIEGRAITGAEFAAMSDDEAVAAIDGIGVIARVTPEHKVHLVETLKKKGHVVAMTGDGVNDAPALKKADIGIAMGITGTEVSKEAAAMILTDDNFATIIRAVELGRALFDNLAKYIRFQMGALVGLVTTFLAASIFNVVGGLPFIPLQTLYVNFTTQIFEAVGLGYGAPSEGLMKRKPRPAQEPILNRSTWIWLGFVGLLMGATTLGVIWGVEDQHNAGLARTMGLATFSFANVLLAFATKDERRSVFSMDTFADTRLVMFSGFSVAAIVAGNELQIFQRILQTESLSFRQWLLCLGAAMTVLVASEIRKIILRRHHVEETPAQEAPAPEAATQPAPSPA
jgi:Ca2+-transporting ATPase